MRQRIASWLLGLSIRIDHHVMLLFLLKVRDDPIAQEKLARFVVDKRR